MIPTILYSDFCLLFSIRNFPVKIVSLCSFISFLYLRYILYSSPWYIWFVWFATWWLLTNFKIISFLSIKTIATGIGACSSVVSILPVCNRNEFSYLIAFRSYPKIFSQWFNSDDCLAISIFIECEQLVVKHNMTIKNRKKLFSLFTFCRITSDVFIYIICNSKIYNLLIVMSWLVLFLYCWVA